MLYEVITTVYGKERFDGYVEAYVERQAGRTASKDEVAAAQRMMRELEDRK